MASLPSPLLTAPSWCPSSSRTVKSNPVPLEDRPSFREEIAFRMTKAELSESMVDKEALTVNVGISH